MYLVLLELDMLGLADSQGSTPLFWGEARMGGEERALGGEVEGKP